MGKKIVVSSKSKGKIGLKDEGRKLFLIQLSLYNHLIRFSSSLFLGNSEEAMTIETWQ